MPNSTATSINIETKLAPGIEQANGAGVPKRRHWPATLAAYLLWQIAALLVVEGLLAVAGLGEEELFRLDRQLGTVHMTNKSITWRKEGYAHCYLDADGMREPHLSLTKPAGVYRVALLGDSQIESIQVPLEKSWGKLLEKQLTETLHRPVEVLNFGVSGYSTVQEYLLMKRQVFKYQPDLVLLGYDGRDMFENWASPDASLSNLRPYALKLPGRPLAIDDSSVKGWMKSPRGKFLLAIEWLRANSRIWGLFSSFETEASAHNQFYKGVINFFTEPVKTFKQFSKDAVHPAYWTSMAGELWTAVKPSFKIEFFDNEKGGPANASSPEASPIGAAPQPVETAKSQTGALPAVKAAPADSQSTVFLGVIKDTMAALLSEMKSECAAHQAKFMVVGMPSRAVLAPIAGMDAPTFGVDCEGELAFVQASCEQNHIPYVDALAPAKHFSNAEITRLFHTAHMAVPGQKYLADTIVSSVAKAINQ